MTELPLYGTVKCCPACGDTRRTLFGKRFCAASLSKDKEHVIPGAFIKRTCSACLYTWRERPLYEDECKCDDDSECDPMSRSRLSGRLGSTKLSNEDLCECGCDAVPISVRLSYLGVALRNALCDLELLEKALRDGR